MILPLLSGLLLLLASPAVGLWPLAFVAYVPLLMFLERGYTAGRLGWSKALLAGYAVGLFHTTSLFFWLTTVHDWSILPVVLTYSLLHASLGAGVLFGLWVGLRGTWLALWTLCFWLGIEVLVSDMFFSLPPYGLGYYLWEQPLLIQVADITGAFGISLWIMAINLLLVRLWLDKLRPSTPWLAVTLCLTAALLGYGGWQLATAGNSQSSAATLQILSLHTHVSVEDKKSPESVRAMFARFSAATRAGVAHSGQQPDLIVWPETSMPVWLRAPGERQTMQELLDIASSSGAAILVGAHSVLPGATEAQVFNAAFLVPPSGYIRQEYHKVILAPGVEKTPFYPLLPEALQQRWPSRLAAGDKPGIMALTTENSIGVFICWEAFFPGHVRQLALAGASVLINTSNDRAAFGSLEAAYAIPLPQAVFRAVENRRPLVRSANSGPSMLINAWGEIEATSPSFSEGTVTGVVKLQHGLSFFTRHGFVLARWMLILTIAWGLFLTASHYRNRR